jgi:hypothetical protein
MTTVSQNDNETLHPTPIQLVENFAQAYKLVHSRDAHVIHVSGDWYRVNGETVHRLTLLGEITRLRHLAQKQRLLNADKGMLQRLITRLRGL